jgi:hypothetical protein
MREPGANEELLPIILVILLCFDTKLSLYIEFNGDMG